MLPILWKIIRFLILTVPVPMAVGSILGGRAEEALGAKRLFPRLVYRWIAGQVLLWAGFQLICVPMILREQTLTKVVVWFSVYAAVLTLAGLGFAWYTHRHSRKLAVRADEPGLKTDKTVIWLWIGFAVLLAIQLVCLCVLEYADGDDAYYVAVSTLAEESDTMYYKNPYSTGYTELDTRHGLAPMPIWVAALARLSGIRTVVVAQVAAPLILVLMAYGVWFLIGEKLLGLGGRGLPLFLSAVALLILFGDYSIYSMERFLLMRTVQGKAILAGIVIPLLFLLLIRLMEGLSRSEKPGAAFWLLIWAVMLTACLCSTQGTVLVCLLTATAGLCGAVSLRKWKFLVPLALTCFFPCVYAALYVTLR